MPPWVYYNMVLSFLQPFNASNIYIIINNMQLIEYLETDNNEKSFWLIPFANAKLIISIKAVLYGNIPDVPTDSASKILAFSSGFLFLNNLLIKHDSIDIAAVLFETPSINKIIIAQLNKLIKNGFFISFIKFSILKTRILNTNFQFIIFLINKFNSTIINTNNEVDN